MVKEMLTRYCIIIDTTIAGVLTNAVLGSHRSHTNSSISQPRGLAGSYPIMSIRRTDPAEMAEPLSDSVPPRDEIQEVCEKIASDMDSAKAPSSPVLDDAGDQKTEPKAPSSSAVDGKSMSLGSFTCGTEFTSSIEFVSSSSSSRTECATDEALDNIYLSVVQPSKKKKKKVSTSDGSR